MTTPFSASSWKSSAAGALDALADRFGHFAGLAVAGADDAGPVSHHHEGAEVEAPAALDDLRHAVDVDDSLFEIARLDSLLFSSCQLSSLLGRMR